jgi:hypothetical protein
VPSSAEHRQLLRFAACIRANGIPAWPDPNTDGQFILPPRIQADAKSLLLTALRACHHLNPNQ